MLYKYRGIKNFKFFVDIILNNRLWAASYKDMNDPMEGYYYYPKGEYSEEIIGRIKNEKERMRIVSLSRSYQIPLMWSHYAEGHRGVAIGVDIDRTEYDIRRIEYTGPAYLQDEIYRNWTPKQILSRKFEFWKYEEEERVFISEGNYVSARVQEVITGQQMADRDYGFIRSLVNSINPDIKVRRFRENNET